ncbi:MAG: hypothetical protein IJ996_01240 [Clostridia bacterium]|nr:hypothetical protein [Clostridia bacterium]
MEDLQSAKEMQALTTPFLEKGFTFTYSYQKGGDSSCVYIYRYQKGKSYFDLREVSGSTEITFVVFVGGEYRFPSLKTEFKKEYRTFKIKHLFKRATRQETRAFIADLLKRKLAENPAEFFGIKL